MIKSCKIAFVFFNFLFTFLIADTIYIVGNNATGEPAYWTIFPPDPPSSAQTLNAGTFEDNPAPAGVAFSAGQTVYIVGQATQGMDDNAAVYWTVSPSGVASDLNVISDLGQGDGLGVAFTPSQNGYIVGVDGPGNAASWPISSGGVVGSSSTLDTGGFAFSVAFASSGTGYVSGQDVDGNASYWLLSDMGATGPFGLVGGEMGGSGSAFTVAVTPEDVAYIVGTTTGGQACYWTISPDNVASSAIDLGAGDNSQARGVAFLSSGAGIIVGQGGGNVPIYWLIASDGTVGAAQPLSMMGGGGSIANAVALSSDGIAYIVGLDDANNATLWTLSLAGGPIEKTLLSGGESGGIATNIAIYFPTAPNPPIALQGRYQTNDFGLVYENCAVLQWIPSDSSGVVRYNIYKNGVKIGSVNGSITRYENHDQSKSRSVLYGVTAVNDLDQESEPDTVILN